MQPDFNVQCVQHSAIPIVALNVEIGCSSPKCSHLLVSLCSMHATW